MVRETTEWNTNATRNCWSLGETGRKPAQHASSEIIEFRQWHKEREREIDRQRKADRQTGRLGHRHADKQTSRQAGKQTSRQADRQRGRQAGKQAVSQTSRQAGRQTDRQDSDLISPREGQKL